jgi:hypothetical protein
MRNSNLDSGCRIVNKVYGLLEGFKSPLIPLSFRRVTRKKQISKGGNLALPLEKGDKGGFSNFPNIISAFFIIIFMLL